MTEPYTLSRRANKIADWIELEALLRGRAVGGDALQDIGSEVGYREPDVGLGLSTMARRLAVLGSAYPFRIANGAVALPEAESSPWAALLLMSSDSPARRSMELSVAAAHLELITATALRELFGPGTTAIRFAWPSEEGRPREFPAAIRWLAQQMNVPLGSAYRPPYNKDGGVDVIAWRPFPDGRSGFPVLLAQCTLEREYRHKATDVEVRVWSGWLALDVDPTTALAIPEVVAAGEEWNALAARTVVLDRIRLTSLADMADATGGLGAVEAWTKETLRDLREAR